MHAELSRSALQSESLRPVLVVDDDPVVRAMIHQALEDEGLTVITAEDGEKALDTATRVGPRLVILDVSLPVLGGEAVAAGLPEIMSDEDVGSWPLPLTAARLKRPER